MFVLLRIHKRFEILTICVPIIHVIFVGIWYIKDIFESELVEGQSFLDDKMYTFSFYMKKYSKKVYNITELCIAYIHIQNHVMLICLH